MKKIVTALTALLIPGMILVLVFLSVNHFMIGQELRRLETLQERLIERNKRYIVQESSLSSPALISSRAENELGRSLVQPQQLIYLEIKSGGEE